MEEIGRSPVEVGSLSHHLQGLYIRGGAGFLPSTVCPRKLVVGRLFFPFELAPFLGDKGTCYVRF